MVTDLYFIRHGEAVSNVEPVIAGVRGNRGLTECGRQQAALLEERLRMSSGGAARSAARTRAAGGAAQSAALNE